MTRISSGSMMPLKYKLNNVCDADHRPANGAQRTMIILIYHNMLYLSIRKHQNAVFRESAAKNVIRIISVLNAYYRRITKIMRIVCVLRARRSISQRLDRHCPFRQKVPPVQSHRRNFYQYQQSDTGCPPSAVYSTAEEVKGRYLCTILWKTPYPQRHSARNLAKFADTTRALWYTVGG